MPTVARCLTSTCHVITQTTWFSKPKAGRPTFGQLEERPSWSCGKTAETFFETFYRGRYRFTSTLQFDETPTE